MRAKDRERKGRKCIDDDEVKVVSKLHGVTRKEDKCESDEKKMTKKICIFWGEWRYVWFAEAPGDAPDSTEMKLTRLTQTIWSRTSSSFELDQQLGV